MSEPIEIILREGRFNPSGHPASVRLYRGEIRPIVERYRRQSAQYPLYAGDTFVHLGALQPNGQLSGLGGVLSALGVPQRRHPLRLRVDERGDELRFVFTLFVEPPPRAPTPEEREPTTDPAELAARTATLIRFWRTHPSDRAAVPFRHGRRRPGAPLARSPEVNAWVLLRAVGHCELCEGLAPFLTDDGEPYLEVHHVEPLSRGGADTPDNAAALCPSCARELQYGACRVQLTRELRARLLDRELGPPPEREGRNLRSRGR